MPRKGQNWDLLVSAESAVLRYTGQTGEFLGAFASGKALGTPTGLRFGPDGHLYVGNVGPDNVLRFDGQTGNLLGVAAKHRDLKHPRQVAFRSDRLFVSSRGRSRVLSFDLSSGRFIERFSKVHPSYAITPEAEDDGLNQPFGIIHHPDGSLLVASYGTDSVRRYHGETGIFIETFACGNGLVQPRNIVYGPDGNLYVTSGNHSVLRFDGKTGSPIDTFVPAGRGGLDDPYGLEFGSDGNLYVVSRGTRSVLRYAGTSGRSLGEFVSSSGRLRAAAYMAFIGGIGGGYNPRRWKATLA